MCCNSEVYIASIWLFSETGCTSYLSSLQLENKSKRHIQIVYALALIKNKIEFIIFYLSKPVITCKTEPSFLESIEGLALTSVKAEPSAGSQP